MRPLPLSAPPPPSAHSPAAIPVPSRRATSSLVLLIASTALFVTAGCSSAHGAVKPAVETDLWGNVIPVECRGDLPAIPVVEVSQAFLDAATETKDRLGLWSRIHVAYVLRGLDAKTRAAVVWHERIHECWFRLTGSPVWHSTTPMEAGQ